ncbi:MAG TPA: hypothetical protein VFY36_00715 [Solirubrobacteraceae bacterium]|nr:hypothetical protein [Solirubrobacteraceae bacterium]
MAKRNPGRRGRSRKRRPTGRPTEQAAAVGEQAPADARTPAKGAVRGKARASAPAYKDPLSVGERPRAPWHPLPLSELLILVGAIGTVVAVKRGDVHNGGAALIASLAAVALGTVEVTLREHLSGYRSHTMILALLPTIVFHSAVILIVAAFVAVPRALTTGMLVLDVALFAFLFKLLRARFLDATRERTFAGRR